MVIQQQYKMFLFNEVHLKYLRREEQSEVTCIFPIPYSILMKNTGTFMEL